MQSPNARPARGRYLPGHVVVSGPPEKLAQLEKASEPTKALSRELGATLTQAPLRHDAPVVYAHNGKGWQATPLKLGVERQATSVFDLVAKLVNAATTYATFQEQRAAQGNVSRRYSFDSNTTLSPNLATSLNSALNSPNGFAVTGFDISPDHIIQHTAGGGHIPGGSPWNVPARTAVAVNEVPPPTLFKEQACWKDVKAPLPAPSAVQGKGVTVVILDTAPAKEVINPQLVDFYISMKGPGGEFDAPTPRGPYPGLKELYSVGRMHVPIPVRPGGADIDEDKMKPYHGLLGASLVRQIAPQATIVLLEVLNDDGETSGSNLTEALDYVLFLQENKLMAGDKRLVEDKLVFNLSLGIPRSLDEEVEAVYLLEACDRACSKGTAVVVAASGNDSYYLHPRNPEEPAAYGYFGDTQTTYDGVIAVSSSGPAPGESALYSNQGNLAAPGVDLLMDSGDEANPGGTRYVYWSGTSFATPLVSAGAALLLSAGAKPKDVKQLLWDGATRPQKWNYVPTLNISGSLQALADRKK